MALERLGLHVLIDYYGHITSNDELNGHMQHHVVGQGRQVFTLQLGERLHESVVVGIAADHDSVIADVARIVVHRFPLFRRLRIGVLFRKPEYLSGP